VLWKKCEIYRIPQNDYDTNPLFKNFRNNILNYDSAFLFSLTRYIVVEGLTNLDIPVDENNSVILIKKDSTLSPPLRFIPLHNRANNINWNFP
jgi:hypothetical protein